MQKIIVFITALLVIGAATAGGFWWYEKQFIIGKADGIEFSYGKKYAAQDVGGFTSDGKTSRIFWVRRSEPISSISLDKEKGAVISANALHAGFLDTLEKNAKKLFPTKYPDYQEKKVERVKLDSKDASVFTFTYRGGNNATVFEKYVLIPKDNDAYYLVIQSTNEAEVAAVWNRFLKTIKLS